MSNSKKLQILYKNLVTDGKIHFDQKQFAIVKEFSDLQAKIVKNNNKSSNLFTSLFKKQKINLYPQGIYLHGSVGRGKSFLMDLFFDEINIKNKKREHFHKFMLATHQELHKRRKGLVSQKYNKESAIIDYADTIADKYKLLCLDEMHIKDITDAMILGRLFTRLLDTGVFVVFTSNFDVDDLYEGGLQRELFLPFIELLKNRLKIAHLQSDKDYRLDRAWREGVWFSPITDKNKGKFNHVFKTLSKNAPTKDIELTIGSRKLIAKNSVENIARFDFETLFIEARGASDYLEISNIFDIVFIENLPQLTDNIRNETRRFITFIDTAYENKTKLVILSDICLDKLYLKGENEFEFQRSLSRLREMQSKDYWEDR